jgi:hypothetical protein
MLKIFRVAFNDGRWHGSMSGAYYEVAETQEEAIEVFRSKNPDLRDTNCSATEFLIDGYVIRVHDERSLRRSERIDGAMGEGDVTGPCPSSP